MYSWYFNETSLVERERPSVMDINRLIAEIRKRPQLWDTRNLEHKGRYYVPDMWKEVAKCVGVDVEQCKRKWKNLRDAYRAEVRRAERRIEKDRLMGEYDPNANYSSKWVYFQAMSFVNDTKRSRYTIEYENANSNSNHNDNEHEFYDGYDTQHYSNMCDIKLEPEHITHAGSNYEIHTLEDIEGDDDDEAANDRLFEKFQNMATPQAAKRVSATMANSLSHAFEHNLPHNIQYNTQSKYHDPLDLKTPTKSPDCNCSKRTDDQVNFLEDLGKEEQKLIISTRKDITRTSKLDHVGDSDYNFLVSFLPQMKKMSELENLQFRAKMCEMVLNILAPSISTNPSPTPITVDTCNTTPTITFQQSQSTADKSKETNNENNTATSTTSNNSN